MTRRIVARLLDFLPEAIGILFGFGVLLCVIAAHDYHKPEDSRVVWICSMQGNKLCGPDTPAILVDPKQLLHW